MGRTAAYTLWTVLTLLSLGAATTGFRRLAGMEAARASAAAHDALQQREALYLPNSQAVRVASLGYSNALSHILWFNTINYFGKNYRGEKNYRWLSHMCNLVIQLNPRAEHVYRFCGTMLAWEGSMPTESVRILDRAVERFPDSWYFYYLRGFTKIYFLADEQGGTKDIVTSASLPNAHQVVVRLAAKKLTAQNSPETAIQFLEETIKITDDASARKALLDRLREAYYELDLRTLEQAVKDFQASHGQFPKSLDELDTSSQELKRMKLNKFLDPYNGRYQVDPQTGEVHSSSNRPRSTVRWNRRTATSGTTTSGTLNSGSVVSGTIGKEAP